MISRMRWIEAIGVSAFLFAAEALAQTSYPMITHTMPVAVQRGKTTEVEVDGRMDFGEVYKALFEGEGIIAEVVKAKVGAKAQAAKSKVTLRLKVAPEAQLGVREFRFASNLGLSSIGQLLVVDEPVVVESGANNTIEKANPIKLPSVVCGRIEVAEDVDTFKFHAEAGQLLTFEVYCARLQDKIHDLQKHADPLLTLLDDKGRELAVNDDFYFADPLLQFKVPKTGDYYLQIRDSIYAGDPRWVYAMVATDRPYVSNIFPMAGNPGQTIDVEPIGSARARGARVPLAVPTALGVQCVQLNMAGVKTNPTAFIVSPLPQFMEQEPNDTPEQANRITIPCGINGRIAVPHDMDHYRFTATKGRALHFEVKARRFGTPLGSSLDSVIDILNAKGAILASNDDTYGKDAALIFTPPVDGDYVLRIRDLNGKGGDTFVYFIEADWASPNYRLRCDPEKAMIGPGSSTAWFVQVERSNGFTGPVTIEVEGLPKGVTVNPLTIPPTMTQGELILTAAQDARRDVASVRVFGTAELAMPDGESLKTRRQAVGSQEVYLPGGGRGVFNVNLQAVAVTDASDIRKIEVTPKVISLQPGKEARLDVKIERSPDYKKSVSLDVMLQHLGRVYGNPLPPGVTVAVDKSKTLLGTGSEGHIVLRAAADAAPIQNVPIAVQAFVSINFVVKVGYSSPALTLNVEKK